jgi:autotransporter-associated beta strand protein
LNAANSFTGDVTMHGGNLIGASSPAFGEGSSSRTLTVNSGSMITFAVGDMYGGHATTAVPTLNIQGGIVTNSDSVHNALNNVVLNGGTLTSNSDSGEWATWNINGTISSDGDSYLNYSGGSGQVMLQSGDQTSPVTAVNIQSGTLTITSPLINGRGSSNTDPRATALTKTGAGNLVINGDSGNTYTGTTTLSGSGSIYLNKTSGYAIPGDLVISGSDSFMLSIQANEQLAPTSNVTWSTTGGWQEIKLLSHTQTVASINDATSRGVIENGWGDSTTGTGTLTVNAASDCSFNGYARDNYAGGGLLAIVKNGAGTLTLSGNNANDFTGGLTINAGIVDFENTENDVAHPYTVNPGGHLVLNGVQLAAASAMSLTAASDVDEYENAVPDTNNGTLSIVGSSYFNARNLVGTGTLMVQDNAVVYAHSLVQDTLVIGGTSSFSPAIAAVPEPGTMMLLACAALAVAGASIRRK